MSDPVITIFEIVQKYLGRTHKIEWKTVQTEINRRSKLDKNVDRKVIKQQVFDDVRDCISVAINNRLVADFQVRLADELVEKFGSNAKDISTEVINNNPDFVLAVKELFCDSLGHLEHGLNEKQWNTIDNVRRLLSVCYKIGENIGVEKTKKALQEATKDLFATDYRR